MSGVRGVDLCKNVSGSKLCNGTVSMVRLSVFLSQHGPTAANPLIIIIVINVFM